MGNVHFTPIGTSTTPWCLVGVGAYRPVRGRYREEFRSVGFRDALVPLGHLYEIDRDLG